MNMVLAALRTYPIWVWAMDKLSSLEDVLAAFGGDMNAAGERIAATGDLEMLEELERRSRQVELMMGQRKPDELGPPPHQLTDYKRMLRSAARHDQRGVLDKYRSSTLMRPELLPDYATAAAEGGHGELFRELVAGISAELHQWKRWVVAAIGSEYEEFALSILHLSKDSTDEDLLEFLWQAEVRNMDLVVGQVEEMLAAQKLHS